MLDALKPVVSTFVSSCEGFAGGEMTMTPKPLKELLVFLLTLFIVLLILSLVGMLLWNSVLVKLVPGIKPATSVFQILGLFILTQFLFN